MKCLDNGGKTVRRKEMEVNSLNLVFKRHPLEPLNVEWQQAYRRITVAADQAGLGKIAALFGMKQVVNTSRSVARGLNRLGNPERPLNYSMISKDGRRELKITARVVLFKLDRDCFTREWWEQQRG